LTNLIKRQILSCPICGAIYQLCNNKDIFRAATASGGDLVECFVDEYDHPDLYEMN